MSSEPILVTGARGATGGATARQLLDRGLPVRAFVHGRDDKTEELASLGADIVVGDFHDAGSLREAMAGVKRAFFIHPWVARLLEATTNFALVAREVGLEVTVNISQITAPVDTRPAQAHNRGGALPCREEARKWLKTMS